MSHKIVQFGETKMLYSINITKIKDAPFREDKIVFLFYTIAKTKSKWIKDLNVACKVVQILIEKLKDVF